MSAQSSDVGKYTCHAENIIGTDRSSGILTVNGKFVCLIIRRVGFQHILVHDNYKLHKMCLRLNYLTIDPVQDLY